MKEPENCEDDNKADKDDGAERRCAAQPEKLSMKNVWA